MNDAENLLRKCGATKLKPGKHIYYLLNGHRFTLTKGKPNYQEIFTVKKILRRMGYIQ